MKSNNENNYELLYDSNNIRSNNPIMKEIEKKIETGEELTIGEKIKAGRDHPIKEINGYELKSYCAYRAVSPATYEKYEELGYIYGLSPDDEYKEYEENGKIINNNKGVDWYLGGASLSYGSVVIECPAYKNYFVLAKDNGSGMSFDPTVRFIKSSGYKNPIPMEMTRLIIHPERNIKLEDKKHTK